MSITGYWYIGFSSYFFWVIIKDVVIWWPGWKLPECVDWGCFWLQTFNLKEEECAIFCFKSCVVSLWRHNFRFKCNNNGRLTPSRSIILQVETADCITHFYWKVNEINLKLIFWPWSETHLWQSYTNSIYVNSFSSKKNLDPKGTRMIITHRPETRSYTPTWPD